MAQLSAIAYVSTTSSVLSNEDIEYILTDARKFNAQVGVTGALLLHDRTFFQYFEGPSDAVESVYKRILASHAHKNITELMHQTIEQRIFSNWLMGFAEAPRSLILQLEQAQWRAAVVRKEKDNSPPPALGLVLDFWCNAQGGQQAH